MEINGRLGNLTPAVSKNPEPMVTKFGMGDDVGDPYPTQNFITIRQGVFAPYPTASTRAEARTK